MKRRRARGVRRTAPPSLPSSDTCISAMYIHLTHYDVEEASRAQRDRHGDTQRRRGGVYTSDANRLSQHSTALCPSKSRARQPYLSEEAPTACMHRATHTYIHPSVRPYLYRESCIIACTLLSCPHARLQGDSRDTGRRTARRKKLREEKTLRALEEHVLGNGSDGVLLFWFFFLPP